MTFPSNPTDGQTYITDATTWVFTDSGWQRKIINTATNSTDYRPGEFLDHLLDVDLDGLQHGDVIRYDSARELWVAAEPTSGSGGTGTAGVDGLGWTGAGYDPATGFINFTSDDGLEFTTGDLRGSIGPQGPTGGQGIQGIQGQQGIQGLTGDTGGVGDEGPQGPPGDIGPQGNPGADSTVAGPQGDVGPQGSPGTNGTNGSDGADGVSPVLSIGTVTPLSAGMSPTVSLSGDVLTFGLVNGADGTDGTDGTNGTDGTDGIDGADSTVAGPQGNPGTNGTNGTNGADGTDGTNGTNGTNGDGFTGGSYNSGTGVVTFTSDDGLGFSTGDLRGADGSGSGSTPSLQDVTDQGSTTTNSIQASSMQLLNGSDIFPDNSTYDRLVVQNSTSGQGAALQIVGPTNGVSEIGFSDNQRNAGLLSYSHTNNSMNFDANGANRVTILSSGNVGVNQSNPTEQLEVNGTCKATAFVGDGSLLTGISGGGGGSILVASYSDTSGGQSVNSSFATRLTGITNAVIEDSPYSNSSGVITISTTGVYEVFASVGVFGSTGNYRYTAELDVRLNSTMVARQRGAYVRNGSGSRDSYVDVSTIINVTAGQTIDFTIRRVNTTSGNGVTVANTSRILIKKLQ